MKKIIKNSMVKRIFKGFFVFIYLRERVRA